MIITPWVLVNFKNKHVENNLVAMGFYVYHTNYTIDCLSRLTYTILDTRFAEILGISPELSTQTHWLYTRIASVLPSSQIQPHFRGFAFNIYPHKASNQSASGKERIVECYLDYPPLLDGRNFGCKLIWYYHQG